MSTKLERSEDCYGLTPEERAEFEEWYVGRFEDNPDYDYAYDRFRAEAWAACAKLNRERLEAANQLAVRRALHICELLNEVEKLQIGNAALLARIKELGAENERLRADAARLDYIESMSRCDPKMGGRHEWWSPRLHGLKGPTFREAIDAAMKGGE